MKINKRVSRESRRQGNGLITVVVITAVLATLAAAALAFTAASVDEVEHERSSMQALYLAEAGISAGLGQIATAFNDEEDTMPAAVGSAASPLQIRGGEFWASFSQNADGTVTMIATGSSGPATRSIETILEPVSPGPFEHSMFAGNFSQDVGYQLELGGTGGQADSISGNIKVGGDVVLTGDASVGGDIVASGTITGASGTTGYAVSIPQILEINFESYHDYNVANEFASAVNTADDAGGTAGQLPASNPAHIFRLNPDDRTSDITSTVKDDYFLEDPYEAVTSDSANDGSDAYQVTLPEDANNSVFYIDGNLWLHNRRSYSLMVTNEGSDPTQVTFVVKGNIYFADNIFYEDEDDDGIAFVALADPAVEDSGNIYFGDPVFGTLEVAEAMMFAENNFYDNNLDEAGSTTVTIRGNMTAGNQVAIDRDFVHGDGSVSHTKLDLQFDDRQSRGDVDLPGIPMQQDQLVGFSVKTWREVPNPQPNPNAPPISLAVQNPHGGGLDASDESIWRERWDEMFGEGWQTDQRVHRWSEAWVDTWNLAPGLGGDPVPDSPPSPDPGLDPTPGGY